MNKEDILSLPKSITENGCWLYFKSYRRSEDGYAIIKLWGRNIYLHRLVAAIWNGKKYTDYSWMACHSDVCRTSCFNPDHLTIGDNKSNMLDAVRNKTHVQSRKTHCPAGHVYDTSYRLKDGSIKRGCKTCKRLGARRRRAK